jgi:CheY-like chemotaxis protein
MRPADLDDPMPATQPRTTLMLMCEQLAAIEGFHAARPSAAAEQTVRRQSRELRMDDARDREVRRREQAALIARSHQQLIEAGEPWQASVAGRAVLAHRNAWFLDKIAEALSSEGILVVAALSNGADAVGCAVAEQPDVMLVDEVLAMLPGEQVVREVRALCPRTVIAAQVESGARVGAMLDAGASPVFTRQVPPAEIAEALLRLVSVWSSLR